MAGAAPGWPGRALARRLYRVLGAGLGVRARTRLSALLIRQRLALGAGSYLGRGVQILGRAHVRIGSNSVIGAGSWLNVNHRGAGAMSIVVGDNCFIGRDNFFSSGRQIVIGDYCLTTVGCRFICSTHVADNPRLPVLATGTTAGDAIAVGANCFFGAGATVMGAVSIGHGSVVGAGSLVLADIAPFSIAVGNPARVIKRFSFSRDAWLAADAVGEADLAANPSEEQYLAMLRAAAPQLPMPWIAAGAEMGSF
ncbi:MAG: DapH/DapD/GlmU-related protein [Pseudomonadota bacterium]